MRASTRGPIGGANDLEPIRMPWALAYMVGGNNRRRYVRKAGEEFLAMPSKGVVLVRCAEVQDPSCQ